MPCEGGKRKAETVDNSVSKQLLKNLLLQGAQTAVGHELPELIATVDIENELGEGVVWNEQTESVWWTDIERSKLFE